MLRSLLAAASFIALLPSAFAAEHEIDPTFGDSGWKRLFESGGGSQNEKGVGIARTADGGYVAVAEVPGGAANGGTGKRIGLFRLDRNGNYVSSGFGINGKVFKDAYLTSVTAMTIDAQGRIIVVGATPGPGNLSDFGIVRFNSNGSDDTSFAGDGGTAFGFDTGSVNSTDAPTSVIAQSDGRIVIAGSVTYTTTTSRFGVIRLNVDGSVDSTFGSNDDGHGGRKGTTDVFAAGRAAYASQIVGIDGGYFVLTGTSVVSNLDTDFAARILTPSGSPWSGFVGSIEVAINEPGPGGSLYDTVTATAVANPTTVVLAGTTSDKSAAVRLVVGKNGFGQYASLNLDSTFTGSAIIAKPYRFIGAYHGDYVQGLSVRYDGQIALAGRYAQGGGTQLGIVTRLTSNGSPNTSVDPSGAYAYYAPTSGSSLSYYTEFTGALYDQGNLVLIGSSADSSANANDLDAVATRLQSDVIFANGFESAM